MKKETELEQNEQNNTKPKEEVAPQIIYVPIMVNPYMNHYQHPHPQYFMLDPKSGLPTQPQPDMFYPPSYESYQPNDMYNPNPYFNYPPFPYPNQIQNPETNQWKQ